VAAYGNKKTATARRVRFGTTAFPVTKAVRIAGTAAQTTGGLTITKKNGKSISVTLAATTKLVVNKQAVSALPTLAANQKVRVVGRYYSNGSFVARRVALKTAA
jgi:hypothetical protein